MAGDAGLQAPLVVYDGRGGMLALAAAYPRTGHTATRLDDGTVLLAGGSSGGGATTDAFLYLRSPLGPFSSLPTLTFEASDAYLPRRPDRVALTGGALELDASAPGEGGRPGELALVAGMITDGVTVTLSAGRHGAAGAAVLFGWISEAAYAFVGLEPGRPVTLYTVSSTRAGQSVVAPVADCSGQALDPTELPDGSLQPITLDWRAGVLQVGNPTRLLLRCLPASAGITRGQVGVGALFGTVAVDNLTLTR